MLANQQNNVFYKYPLISTNPCGEIWLPAYGCCDLGAVVLPRFVSAGQVRLGSSLSGCRLGVRFLDDVLYGQRLSPQGH
jgi:ribonucleoside-diphosphate reductase alpha chain